MKFLYEGHKSGYKMFYLLPFSKGIFVNALKCIPGSALGFVVPNSQLQRALCAGYIKTLRESVGLRLSRLRLYFKYVSTYLAQRYL